MLSDQNMRLLRVILLFHRKIGPNNPKFRLTTKEVGDTVDVLLHQKQIGSFEEREFLYLEHLLRALADGLLSLLEAKCTVTHCVGENWYKAISELFEIYILIRNRKKQSQCEIERWNVAFQLIHCQSLFLSLPDGQSPLQRLGERTLGAAEAAAHIYSGQYVNGKDTILKLIRFRRSRPEWHSEYLIFNNLGFNILCFAMSTKSTIDTPNEVIFETVRKIRDRLGTELGKEKESPKTSKLRKMGCEFTRKVNAMGPYEEHDDYFSFGLVELLWQLCFIIPDCDKTFGEVLGAVYTILDRSSLECLRQKAIQIYFTTKFLGEERKRNGSYGGAEAHEKVKSWLVKKKYDYDAHKNEITEYFCNVWSVLISIGDLTGPEEKLTK